MGEAIIESPAMSGANGPALRRNVPAYEPESEAYGKVPNAIEAAKAGFDKFFREARAGNARLTVSTTISGQRETISLDGAQAAEYLTRESVSERYAYLAKRLVETRRALASEAVNLLRSGRTIESLHPAQEAALREFHGIVSSENGERLREDLWSYGPSALANSTPFLDQEFLPFGQGPLGTQLYLADMWDQLAKAWWAWHHDPLAKRGVNLVASYSVGRGVRVICKDDEEAQSVVDEFWEREEMDLRLLRFVGDLGKDGELFVRDMPVTSNPSKTKVRALDPTTIWEIITDAEDIESVYCFVQRYMTRTQLFPPPDGSPAQVWIERELLPNEVIHVKVNATSTEVRGRSDAYVVLGMLKRLRDYLTSEVLKAQAQAAWHRDIKISGSDAQVQAFAQQQATQGAPQPGEDWFHNDAVEISLVNAPNRAPMGNGTVYAGLVNLVAIGFGLSKEDFGVTEHASLASAEESGTPSEFTIDGRQKLIASFVKRLIRRVLRRALGSRADSITLEVIMPEVRREDFEKRMKNFALGVAMDWWSNETAANNAASEIGLRDYDYGEEQDRIADERPSGFIAKEFEQVPRGLGGAAFAPGDVVNPNATQESVREHGIVIVP